MHQHHTSPLWRFCDSAAAYIHSSSLTHLLTCVFKLRIQSTVAAVSVSTYVQLQHLSTGFCQRHSYKPSTLDACFRASMSPTRRLFSTCPLFTLQVCLYILNLSTVWSVYHKNISANVLAKAFNARGCTLIFH